MGDFAMRIALLLHVIYWFFFLKLLLLALFKLPNFAGVVYRGVNPPSSIIAA